MGRALADAVGLQQEAAFLALRAVKVKVALAVHATQVFGIHRKPLQYRTIPWFATVLSSCSTALSAVRKHALHAKKWSVHWNTF